MDLSLLFTICNSAVMPFWLLLIVAPRWIWTERLVHSALVPMLLGALRSKSPIANMSVVDVPETQTRLANHPPLATE